MTLALQAAALVLLLVGSWLIFEALLALDGPPEDQGRVSPGYMRERGWWTR